MFLQCVTFIALLLSCCPVLTTAGVKGVHPLKRGKYTNSDSPFSCLDGQLTVPFNRVNDDYCDCADGSDEPGTAACANGTFYCENRGHIGRSLTSAFVNDGVCDCCDGTDELAGCNNYCSELGMAVRKEKQALLAHYKLGAQARAKLIGDATAQRAAWLKEETELNERIEQLRPVVASLLEDKVKLEEQQAALAPVAAEEPEPVEADTEPETPVEWKDPRDPATWDNDDEEHDHYHGVAGDAADASDPAASGAAEQAADLPTEAEDPEEIGRRIAAQWTTNPEAAGSHGKEPSPDAAVPQQQECSNERDGQCSNPDVATDAAAAPAADAPQGAGFLKSVRSMVGGLFGKNESDAAAADAAGGDDSAQQVERLELQRRCEEARTNYDTEERNVRDAESQLEKLRTRLKRDHGPEGVFAYMEGACYDWSDNKYTYSVCGFGQAQQKEGAAVTTLGTFSGFEDHYTVMTFTGGTVCWQGPARSIKVTLQCGATTQLQNVAEPSRCQYTATLTTPAACSPDVLHTLQEEVTALQV